MGSIEHLWNEFLDILRHGLDEISNPVVGIFIALIAGLMVRGFVNIFVVALLAVVLHILSSVLIPWGLNHAPLVFPNLDHALFLRGVTLYVAYFVVIFAIWGVRRIFASVRG
jgi:hypothetical protein